jgi:hypothetical protein
MKLITQLPLVLGSKMHGAIPPLSQYAFMAWCSVKAQGQFYLYILPLLTSYKCCKFTMKFMLFHFNVMIWDEYVPLKITQNTMTEISSPDHNKVR